MRNVLVVSKDNIKDREYSVKTDFRDVYELNDTITLLVTEIAKKGMPVDAMMKMVWNIYNNGDIVQSDTHEMN